MATTQLQRPKSKTQNWSSIFPEEQVTETQSMLFVKKLLAVGVSSITYLRAIFPEVAFGDRCLEDLKLKILREDNTCPGACQVIQWMKGCFDALDKKYLYMILIGIYDNPDDPDTVIEQYTFKFTYKGKNGIDIYRNNEKIVGATTEEETKKATIRLLRTLILLSQTLSSLPDDVMMSMKLLYYDDVTPVDYQPPGFKECNADAFKFSEEAMSIKVGEVTTPFHSMKLKIGTVYHQLKFKDEDEVRPIQHESIYDAGMAVLEEKLAKNAISNNEGNCESDKENSDRRVPDTCDGTQQSDPAEQTEGDEPFGTAKQIPDTYDNNSAEHQSEMPLVMEEGTAEEVPQVECPCGVNEDDGLMILCAVCETWQHAVCFAILEFKSAPASHVCASCAKRVEAHKCTDQRLERLSESELQATCLWRRTLVSVSEMTRVTPSCLAKRLGVGVNIATHLVKRLEKEGFVKATSKNKRLGKLVNKQSIMKEGMRNYFLESDSDSMPINDENSEPNEEESVASIVAKASKIELEEKRAPLRSQTKSMEKEMMEIKNILQTKGNGRKRAVSKLNADDEFEISDSQDLCDIPEDLLPAKRRKASSTLHSLYV